LTQEVCFFFSTGVMKHHAKKTQRRVDLYLPVLLTSAVCGAERTASTFWTLHTHKERAPDSHLIEAGRVPGPVGAWQINRKLLPLPEIKHLSSSPQPVYFPFS
jgi:hypothetical protein